MAESTFTSKGIIADTQRGLRDDPPWLSSLYFYDEHGSDLFEQITATLEYYPTRTELAILERHGEDILDAAGADIVLAELGSGSSAKTRSLLGRLLDHQGPSTYIPVDVSGDFLATVATELQHQFPGLTVDPIAAEYAAGLSAIGERPGRKLVLFLGSSIGNFEPDEQVGLLRAACNALAPGDAFLLGTDLVKDAEVLEAAYNDEAGVTAAFNLNILTHLDREMNAANDHDAWRHVALWNPEQSRIEMHLEATRDTVLEYTQAHVRRPFAKGERIHTENSYKFTPEQVTAMVTKAGWTLERSWLDEKAWFGLHLLRRP